MYLGRTAAYGSLHTWNLLAGLHQQHWSWTVLTPPVLSPCCWRHSWDGWAMSLGWRNIACHEVWHNYGELASGKRYLGHPKKCYKDSFKGNLHWCNIKPKDFKSCAGDRLLWRARVHQATTSFEDARSQWLAAVSVPRHKTTSPVTTTKFHCPTVPDSAMIAPCAHWHW